MARLNNLRKLYLVPVLAIRQMLARKLAGDETRLSRVRRLKQAELIAEVERELSVSEEDVEQLYELYRYGRRLSLQLFLLPEDYALSTDDATIETALTNAAEAVTLAGEIEEIGDPNDDDFSSDEVSGQVTICDHVRFGDVLEIRFKYLILHRFLNRDEVLDQVHETRYGYVWLCPIYRYLAVLAKDDLVAKTMLETITTVLSVTPRAVQFPKELVDQHFPLESLRRVSHLNPRSGVRQSISGESMALQEHLNEIANRDRQNQRPGALYDERITDTFSSGLGITTRRGKIYFTRTLSTSQIQQWRDGRLRAFIADLHAILAERPLDIYQPTAVVLRQQYGLDSVAQEQLQAIRNGIIWAKRNGLQTVQLGYSAHDLYHSLGNGWLQPYLSCDCPECDDACGLCPNCGQAKFSLQGQELICSSCRRPLTIDGIATLRCVNDHTHHFEISEALGYVPTNKLALQIKEAMRVVGLEWDIQRESLFLDRGGLHYLSTPADTMQIQVDGDYIHAQIGAGASHVIVGKDIVIGNQPA